MFRRTFSSDSRVANDSAAFDHWPIDWIDLFETAAAFSVILWAELQPAFHSPLRLRWARKNCHSSNLKWGDGIMNISIWFIRNVEEIFPACDTYCVHCAPITYRWKAEIAKIRPPNQKFLSALHRLVPAEMNQKYLSLYCRADSPSQCNAPQ